MFVVGCMDACQVQKSHQFRNYVDCIREHVITLHMWHKFFIYLSFSCLLYKDTIVLLKNSLQKNILFLLSLLGFISCFFFLFSPGIYLTQQEIENSKHKKQRTLLEQSSDFERFSNALKAYFRYVRCSKCNTKNQYNTESRNLLRKKLLSH